MSDNLRDIREPDNNVTETKPEMVAKNQAGSRQMAPFLVLRRRGDD